MSGSRWDLYTWVGSGDVKIRVSNVSLKEAKKAKEKWLKKSPKHEAFIALHADKAQLKDVLKTQDELKKDKKKAKKAHKPDKVHKADKAKKAKQTKHMQSKKH